MVLISDYKRYKVLKHSITYKTQSILAVIISSIKYVEYDSNSDYKFLQNIRKY